MCGRFASSRTDEDVVAEYEVEHADESPDPVASWNVAPTDPVRMVVERADRTTGEVTRQLRRARWGLVPSWARDPSVGSRMINARVETIAQKPAFARAFAQRRALLPADGYYEWQAPGPARAAKQPFFLHPADDGTLALAGLYEFWRDPAKAADDPARWLVTVTVVTRPASPALAHIHDRQPLMLRRADWAAWLDPAVGADEARALLTADGPQIVATPVSTAVNAVANDGPHLVAPVPLPPA